MTLTALSTLDYSIIGGFFLLSIFIGVYVSKSSANSSDDFFLSGRKMPWWLLGVSMVATTFAADTPGLVTELVRDEGVSGNWAWWYMLLTGTLTVFFYARLWRKSGVTTDLEFYELRYSGKSAAFLRGFRAIYLGFFFNVVTMAAVCLAGAKIAAIMFGMDQLTFLLIAGGVTVIYSMLGGLKGVLITDFFQFIMAMIGSVWATYYIVNMPEIGGLDNLIASIDHQTLSIFPDTNNSEKMLVLIIIPFAVQWWSTWYPGAEPGGGGYIAQRMLAAKDEKNATYATLFFNFAHYALRPWPWILIALASLIIFPDLESIKAVFSDVDPKLIKGDAAYSAMLTMLPAGLIGIVLASLIAAFMSTISTQLNWGSSYMVNDVYKRFIKNDASEKEMVSIGRWSTVLLMICGGAFSFVLQSASEFLGIMLQIGAGTGLLFILRWFWKPINPYSEITAMGVSFLLAIIFLVYNQQNPDAPLTKTFQMLFGVGFTTVCWVMVSLLTNPTKKEVIENFEKNVFEVKKDGAIVISKFHNFGFKILGFFLSTIGIYSALFATGYFLYSEIDLAWIFTSIFTVCVASLLAFRKKMF
jgi:solute:Na+ symporter, SSS family